MTPPAETLRRAAALMRERAEAVGDGWYSAAAWATASPMSLPIEKADAEHIASWHPDVALAVADSLVAAAVHIESHECEAHCEPDGCEFVVTATRTARTYLREQS